MCLGQINTRERGWSAAGEPFTYYGNTPGFNPFAAIERIARGGE
jgi:hypothetical protein